jgi:hypothetical protein
MKELRDITVLLCNYNGMRNQVNGRGRVAITIDSLLKCCPYVEKMNFYIIDNYSTDGSWEYIQSLSLGEKIQRKRSIGNQNWLITTKTNLSNLKEIIFKTDKKYVWNIENDSYFFNSGNFLFKALEVLESSDDVSLVHFRKWTRMDAMDLPGVPRNLTRVSENRISSSSFEFYVMQKRCEYALWIPLKNDIGSDFKPDLRAERGKCPMNVEMIGAVRLNRTGEYERLLTEHWNSYTNHGWLAKTKDIKFLIEKYHPMGERQLSMVFKKHFKAARLDEDAFLCFGWNHRFRPSEKEIIDIFDWVYKDTSSSISEFGNYAPNYDASYVAFDEKKINVYL